MIIARVCQVRPDHFKVNWVEGHFWVNKLVQDYSWKGSLRVIWYVAVNGRELMVECMGWDESGRKIIRFLNQSVVLRNSLPYLAYVNGFAWKSQLAAYFGYVPGCLPAKDGYTQHFYGSTFGQNMRIIHIC